MSKKTNLKISIVEVGLRDGLQNEPTVMSVENRLNLARKLVDAGIRRLELGSFVRGDKIPQMADSKKLIMDFFSPPPKGPIRISALVPNEKGMLQALQTPLQEVAVFAATSETFSKKNINCSIQESFQRFAPVLLLAKKRKIKVRGYLSTCFGCPYEGNVPEKTVLDLAYKLYSMGCYEISIGDTIGVATPAQVVSLFQKLKKKIPSKALAGHFHDTRGTALANIFAAYERGIRTFDTSIGGLGGCPYAPGASGNVSTEDVVYMFEGSGISTGIQLEPLIAANRWLSETMGKALNSKVGKAGLARPLLFKGT